ncbi:hypothetical protein ACIRBY_23270 [Streptomyces sp. NPDC096136]|uniref:hypothetical protein n=1 Tax=Streptomyces sp. NPDC096136 TaxID=3366076 RepID=UPI0038140C42
MTRLQPAAERLCRGAAIVLTRYTAATAGWVRAADSLGGRALRASLLALPALLAWRIVRAAPGLLWLAVPWWCWVIWRAAPQPSPEAAEEVAIRDPAEDMRGLLRELIGDAAGVHLSTVLAYLQERGHHPTWKVSDLRRRVEALGIPVDPKLKLAGTPTRGVRREAVSTTPRPTTPGASPVPSPAP